MESSGASSVTRYTHDLELTRGAFGGRPLFYAIDGGEVLVCERVGPLVECLGRPPTLNRRRLASLIADLPMRDLGETHFEGVYRVPSAHRAHISIDGRRYHEPIARFIGPTLAIAPEEAAIEVHRLIRASVARAIKGQKRIGVLAGGGVDSSALLAAVVAEARGAGQPEIDAITLHFAGPGDDRPHMRVLAEALGITPIRVAPRDGGPLVRKAFVVDQTPFVRTGAASLLALMTKAAERGASLVLTGNGGDDIFDGDPRILSHRILSGEIVQAIVQAARLRVPWTTNPLRRVSEFLIRPLAARLIPSALQTERRRRLRRRGCTWAGPELQAFLDTVVVDNAPNELETPTDRLARFRTSPDFLEAADERSLLEQASGVLRIDPFLDDDLIEFVMRLPPLLLFHGSQMRGLFRLALKGLIPESVRLRPDKADFEPAFIEVMEAAGGLASFRDLAAMPNLAALGLVDPSGYRGAFDAFASQPLAGESWVSLWPALAVEAFAESRRTRC